MTSQNLLQVLNSALPGRCRVNGERMDAASEFRGQRRIDHAVTFEPALPSERLRHDIDSEMRLPTRPMSSVHRMLV